jgi:D-alanyl-lipoteichoic acid acyltransferase DltB (MBOAT superfamily)
MLFNSLPFALFLPVVLAGTFALPPGARKRFWLAASLLFYGWWDWRFLALLVFTAAVDWVCARRIEDDPARRRVWLTISVLSNLGVLGAFKYLGFFTAELARLLTALGLPGSLPVLELALPVGLSFYTFQAMAYTIDVYRGVTPACRGFLDFLLFITFFPQLVAGPIERSRDLLPQLVSPRVPSPDERAVGAWLILWGFLKKLLIADNLAPVVARGFDTPAPSSLAVVVAAYAFTWQIYCDFSGYSDIARGVAALLGVSLRENFRLPFFAASPRDIWKRWHISLSEWLRDYLYIPLGGGRTHATPNLLVTMLLGGLWHGASWTFVAWGAWHGAWLALQRRLPLRLPRPLAVVLTFHVLVVGFVVFRAHTLTQVIDLARAAFTFTATAADLPGLRLVLVLTVPLFLVELWMERRGDPLAPLHLPRPVQAVGVLAASAAVFVLGSTYGAPFLYFRF